MFPPLLPLLSLFPRAAIQSLHRHLLFNEVRGPSSESLKLDFWFFVHKDFGCLFALFSPFSSPGMSVLPGCPTQGVRLISNAQSPRKTIPRFFWFDEQPVATINPARQIKVPNINIVLCSSVFDTSTSLSDKRNVAISQKRHGSQAKRTVLYIKTVLFSTVIGQTIRKLEIIDRFCAF